MLCKNTSELPISTYSKYAGHYQNPQNYFRNATNGARPRRDRVVRNNRMRMRRRWGVECLIGRVTRASNGLLHLFLLIIIYPNNGVRFAKYVFFVSF